MIGCQANIAATFTPVSAFARLLRILYIRSPRRHGGPLRYRTSRLFVGAFAALAACSGSDSAPSITTPSLSKPAILDSAAVDAPVHDLVHDQKRGVLYLAEPDRGQIAVYSLGTHAYRPPVTGFDAASMDLSLGGDSLILVSASSAVIGIIDLRATTPHADTVHVQMADSLGLVGTSLRLLRGNAVFVTMHPTGIWGCGVGRVFQYDLAAATYTLRTDVDCVTEAARLVRSIDRTRMLMMLDGSSPMMTTLYDEPSDRFSANRLTAEGYGLSGSADSSGKRYLVGSLAIDDQFVFGSAVGMHLLMGPGGISAMSPDGVYAYVFDDRVLTKYHILGVTTAWSFTVPGTDNPYALYSLSDGSALVALTISHLYTLKP